MQIRPPKKMYIPALSIVAVVMILLVLISVSTFRNLDREKRVALDFVHRKGMALIHAVEAGVRAGMSHQRIREDPVADIIQETGKIKDIAYLYIVDGDGNLVHRSHSRPGTPPLRWRPTSTGERETMPGNGRVRALPDGTQVYEIHKTFEPFSRRRHHLTGEVDRAEPLSVVVALGMKDFDEARKYDIQHAFIMAGIVLALGTGVIFFIFVIQNYYLVNRALKQTKDYTRLVIDHMADGLLSIDIHGNIRSFNRLALELLDQTPATIFEVNLTTLIDFKTSGIFNTLNACETIIEKEIHITKSRGEGIPLSLSVTPITGESRECRGAVIVLRDLREIRLLEKKVQRAEKLAAVGKLAAGVAHEIRNPLSSIKGFAQFFKQMFQDQPDARNYADIMVKEVDRINRVVTDLLVFAKPADAEKKPTDMGELIDHVIQLVKQDADARRVTLKPMPTPETELFSLDGSQMTQVLLNLLLNSLQAVAPGGVIELGAQPDQKRNGLKIWVQDDGPGIPRAQQKRVFEPFFTTRDEGTGVGLAIVHKIVEHHHGEIRIDSPLPEKTGGCRVTLWIPAEEAGGGDR